MGWFSKTPTVPETVIEGLQKGLGKAAEKGSEKLTQEVVRRNKEAIVDGVQTALDAFAPDPKQDQTARALNNLADALRAQLTPAPTESNDD